MLFNYNRFLVDVKKCISSLIEITNSLKKDDETMKTESTCGICSMLVKNFGYSYEFRVL